eukprot:558597-Ditylum_brightwellii.AAC.1
MASLRRDNDINREMVSLHLHCILFFVCLGKNCCDNDDELSSWGCQSTMEAFGGLEVPDDAHASHDVQN